jgi:hypothetical protein
LAKIPTQNPEKPMELAPWVHKGLSPLKRNNLATDEHRFTQIIHSAIPSVPIGIHRWQYILLQRNGVRPDNPSRPRHHRNAHQPLRLPPRRRRTRPRQTRHPRQIVRNPIHKNDELPNRTTQSVGSFEFVHYSRMQQKAKEVLECSPWHGFISTRVSMERQPARAQLRARLSGAKPASNGSPTRDPAISHARALRRRRRNSRRGRHGPSDGFSPQLERKAPCKSQ